MNPGVIILHLTHGFLATGYKHDAAITAYRPNDFEWFSKKDKITFLHSKYHSSTVDNVVANAFICTTRDLFDHLYAKRTLDGSETKTMVIAIIHGDKEVIDHTIFYIESSDE